MAEDFLEYIDKLHKAYLSENAVSNRYFFYYIPLKSITIPTHEEFYVSRSRKSRFLINHNSVWVDLTDYDIIDIICRFDDESAAKMLKKLADCYHGIWTDFEFEIQEQRYLGKGIDCESLNLDTMLDLDADFQICLGDFLFLLSMVMFKDIVGQNYLKKSQDISLIERTLIKYITLIKYYKFGNAQAQDYLSDIGYPACSRKNLLLYKASSKKHDKKFNKNAFEKAGLL